MFNTVQVNFISITNAENKVLGKFQPTDQYFLSTFLKLRSFSDSSFL